MKAIVCSLVMILLIAALAISQTATVPASYLTAQEALAANDYAKAKTALTALAAQSTGDVKTKATACANAANLAAMREAFKPLSEVVAKMTLPNGYAVAFCPMFKGGAPWVQKQGTISNPYFGKGSEMASCGEFKKK